jgi:hypothetical protein
MVKQKGAPKVHDSFATSIPYSGVDDPTSSKGMNYWDEVERQKQLAERQAFAASILPKRPALLSGRIDINSGAGQGGVANTTPPPPTYSNVESIVAAHQQYPSFQRSLQQTSDAPLGTLANAPSRGAGSLGAAMLAPHDDKREARIDTDVNRLLDQLHVEHEGIQQVRPKPSQAAVAVPHARRPARPDKPQHSCAPIRSRQDYGN